MIRRFRECDLPDVMRIWLDTNIKTHHFISKEYWISNYDMVKEILPKAEVYVYKNDTTNLIEGFIGVMYNHIAGLFVKETNQGKGIGKQLLDYVKSKKSYISLSVFQKNTRAIHFYHREHFQVQSENIDDNTNEKELIMTWSN